MVIDTKTFEVLHRLTEEGEIEYNRLKTLHDNSKFPLGILFYLNKVIHAIIKVI